MTAALATLSPSHPLTQTLHIRRWESYNGLVLRGRLPPKNPALKDEATALLHQIDQALTPLSEEGTRRQLTLLVASLGQVIANPPSGQKMQQWIDIATLAMHDVPRHCWGKNALRRAMQRFTFMPSPAELHTLLHEEARDLREKRAQIALFLREPSSLTTSHDVFYDDAPSQ